MTRLYSNGAFVDDTWRYLADQDPLPIEGRAIVSLTRWRAEQLQLVALGVPLGVKVEVGDTIDALADDIGRLALVALSFPKFTDGRSYSKGRLLREQYGFKGEIRAVGEVLLDQIPLMLRCGFDAFEVGHEPTIRALEQSHLPAIQRTYQTIGAHGVARRRLA